jgi:hypothetical protein
VARFTQAKRQQPASENDAADGEEHDFKTGRLGMKQGQVQFIASLAFRVIAKSGRNQREETRGKKPEGRNQTSGLLKIGC